jgi:hypothetical protein
MSPQLEKKLNKKYQPSSMVSIKFSGNDVSIKTDEEGNPMLIFIGKMNREGRIKGERYVRTLLKNSAGDIIKDHWDLKGKVS